MTENTPNTPENKGRPSSSIPRSAPPPSQKSNKTGLYVTIIIILVIGLSVALFFTFQKKRQVEQKDSELLTAYERLDSISDVLGTKIIQIEELGGDVEELDSIKTELEKEKENLLKNKKYSDRQIRDLNDRLEGYKELLVMKDTEIEELKQVNEQLVTENTELKTERNVLHQTIQEAEKTKDELQQKVKVASQLEAENIAVYAISSGGKEREGEFRARQIDQLKVEFSIAKNDVAPIEGKEIFIRVLDENNNPIFDVAKGSGTFMLDGKETFYTAKQEILFDNTQQSLSFIYDKETEYERGTYKMEIYTDGYMMGSKTFRVK